MNATAKFRLASIVVLLALGACTSVPTGPTVPVMPGTGKNLEQFRADDAVCQRYALELIDASPEQATIGSGARNAAANPAAGATKDAAMAKKERVGVDVARPSAFDRQRRYDLGYIQCMYAKGHRVPVLGPMTMRPAQASSPPAPAPTTLPSAPH